MPSELSIRAVHQGGWKVETTAREHALTLDYPAVAGNAGFTPLELLLASLGACAANTLVLLAKRAGIETRGIEVEVRGVRRDEHPTVFTAIDLVFVVRGDGVDRTAIERLVGVAEAQLCPVWALLKPGVPIASSVRIES